MKILITLLLAMPALTYADGAEDVFELLDFESQWNEALEMYRLDISNNVLSANDPDKIPEEWKGLWSEMSSKVLKLHADIFSWENAKPKSLLILKNIFNEAELKEINNDFLILEKKDSYRHKFERMEAAQNELWTDLSEKYLEKSGLIMK